MIRILLFVALVLTGLLVKLLRKTVTPAQPVAAGALTRQEPEPEPSGRGRRGRYASGPMEIPARGWWEVLLRVKDEFTHDNITFVAASVAFYALLAIFPAIATLVSIYGLVSDPATVEEQLSSVAGFVPAAAWDILREQLTSVAAGGSESLSIGVVLGILLTAWSARAGTSALVQGLNVAWDEKEDRNFFHLTALLVALTLFGVVSGVVALGLVAVLPVLIGVLPLGDVGETVVGVARWPLLAGWVILFLAVLYRFGPARRAPKWRWITPGAVLAMVLWVAASVGFSVYVSNFGSYNETYGSVGAVVVLMMWFWITGLVVLLGAELDSELEHQTTLDTTVGASRPPGERGARAADTLAT